jgi:hypothetical protein
LARLILEAFSAAYSDTRVSGTPTNSKKYKRSAASPSFEMLLDQSIPFGAWR